MRYTYLATFISGTKELVETGLHKELSDIEILNIYDGCVTFSTSTNFNNLNKLLFVNNVFLLLKEYIQETFDSSIRWIHTHNLEFAKPITKKLDFYTFRVRFINANTFVSFDKKEIEKIEIKVKGDLQLKLNKLTPDTEIWFMQRSEGVCYVLLRLTNESKVEHRNKGQLRPELAHLMCLLSEPNLEDIFLDPFAGYGTIIEARQHYLYKEIIGFEKANTLLNKDIIFKQDFFENNLLENTISKIVTDPPWGLYDKTINTQKFYNHMFKECYRLLQNNGLLVILLNRDTSPTNFIKEYPFKIEDRYDILVSGKKATIWKLTKI